MKHLIYLFLTAIIACTLWALFLLNLPASASSVKPNKCNTCLEVCNKLK